MLTLAVLLTFAALATWTVSAIYANACADVARMVDEALAVEADDWVEDETPTFDAVLAEHPWVAEALLAAELADDKAVERWLA